MSWAETSRINKNVKKTLNEQLRDMRYNIIEVITQTGVYSPVKSGLYKVICVGAGGYGTRLTQGSTNYYVGGSGGGVAIKNIRLTKGASYSVTVSTTASFGNIMTATGGVTRTYSEALAGTATGGDYNFDGEAGEMRSGSDNPCRGGSVGVYIPSLSRTSRIGDFNNNDMLYGDSIMNYGGGGPAVYCYYDSENKYVYTLDGLPAAVLIIPIEVEV